MGYPMSIDFVGKGWSNPSLGFFVDVVKVTTCVLLALFFLARGEAYKSPVRTKALRPNCREKVTTACYCP